jgi:hypothetical protein
MRKSMIGIAIAGLLGLGGLVGCGEETGAEKTTTVTTPGGTTSTTTSVEVEKSGENPPPAP